jgi:hypothetical protein
MPSGSPWGYILIVFIGKIKNWRVILVGKGAEKVS